METVRACVPGLDREKIGATGSPGPRPIFAEPTPCRRRILNCLDRREFSLGYA